MGGHGSVKYLGSPQKLIASLQKVNAKNVSGLVWDLVPFPAR